MITYDKIYINGAWVPSEGKGVLEVTNSATEEIIATIPDGTTGDVDKAVAAQKPRLKVGAHCQAKSVPST